MECGNPIELPVVEILPVRVVSGSVVEMPALKDTLCSTVVILTSSSIILSITTTNLNSGVSK